MGKVNWTVVAISAGVTLGASVAVLSTSEGTPEAGGGQIIVPQSAPVEESVRPPVQVGKPELPAPPKVSVVAVDPAGYTVPAPPPVVAPPPPPPVVKVKASVSVNPKQLVKSTATSTTKFVSQVIGLAPNPWEGWFGQPVSTTTSRTSVTSFSAQPTSLSYSSTGIGRHRAINRDGSGGRHCRY